MRACLRRNQPGPYQLQAAIAAVHSDAPSAGATDWRQVVALYDHMQTIAPTPVVSLNRAVAVGEVDGPAKALAIVDGLGLHDYHLFHAVRADLLVRLGRRVDAGTAYARAIDLTTNSAERDLLERRRFAGSHWRAGETLAMTGTRLSYCDVYPHVLATLTMPPTHSVKATSFVSTTPAVRPGAV